MGEPRRNAGDDAALDFGGTVAPRNQSVRRFRIEPCGGENRLGATLGRKVAIDVAPLAPRGEADRHRPLANAETYDRNDFELFVIRACVDLAIKPRARARFFWFERFVTQAAGRADVDDCSHVYAATGAVCRNETRCHA